MAKAIDLIYKTIESKHPIWLKATLLFEGIDRLLGICEQVFFVLANICLGFLLTINMVNIASRLVLERGIAWVWPWSVVLFVWMVFLTLFIIYRTKKDITVDFLIDRLGMRWRLASRLLVNVFTLILMGVILWQGPQIFASQVGAIEMVGIPRYTESIPLFISCSLIFANFIVDTVFALDGREASKPNRQSK